MMWLAKEPLRQGEQASDCDLLAGMLHPELASSKVPMHIWHCQW